MLKEKVSIIIPVFNEVQILPLLVSRLQGALEKLSCSYELVFIDDHSHDGSYEILLGMSSPSLIVTRKIGKKGKAFSLIQGFNEASGTIIGMIDADLQYAPEDIPAMVKLLEESDVVVANRKSYNDNIVRRSLSRTYKTIFGKMLFNLNVDIQSGLKVFRRDVIDVVTFVPRSGWTFDLEFLTRVRHAGFRIKGHDITFHPRSSSTSKINLLGSTLEIGSNAFRVRSRRVYPMHSNPRDGSMLGAGVHFKKKKYVTHTTLPHGFSALRTFEKKQQLLFFSLLALMVSGLLINPFMTGLIIVALLSALYFIDTLFNLFVVMKSLSTETEITSTHEELSAVDESSLPVYTILCPLYKESHIIPHFLDAISKLDWPKGKLDVMLLLEEDDKVSVEAVKHMDLPSYVRAIVVPDSQPKTKPKACNYGLAFAKGEFLVIYDAEDIPDTQQLKKAFLAFKKVPKNVVCLQAKLNYFNPHQNLLTRFFTAEYSLWFDVSLTGLQAIGSIMPLGGTSNHFKTKDLHMLQGWDPFNVTEDADLGMRLFKKGYRTAMIDSVTLEEANSNVKNWIRQRSRWIKGYMQTYLVHLRDIVAFTRERGRHSLVFHLVLGGKLGFILINPLLWITTISYFIFYAMVGETIESLFPSWVFYMAGFSLVFGNFLFLYYYMIGCLKRGHYSLIKYVYLVPIYWILISISGFMAFYQLLFKPHYWEKTVHGLHLDKANSKKVTITDQNIIVPIEGSPAKPRRISFSAAVLVIASLATNVLTLGFYVWSSRLLDLPNIAILGVFGSFFNIANILFLGLSSTVGYRSGFLFGRYGQATAHSFWKRIRLASVFIGFGISLVWIGLIPVTTSYFALPSYIPLLFVIPMLITGVITSVDRGYLSGKLSFIKLGVIGILEPIAKIAVLQILVIYGLTSYAYTAIPLASVFAFFVAWLLIVIERTKPVESIGHEASVFPAKFFFASILTGLSSMIFISVDLLLASHYLSVKDAGIYTLISLTGKMIFFLGGLLTQFIIPLVSVNEGSRQSSAKLFSYFFNGTALISFVGFIVFGYLSPITLPIIFGPKATEIIGYVPLFAYGMFCFTLSRALVSFYLSKKVYSFTVISFLLSLLFVGLIIKNHGSVQSFVNASFITGTVSFMGLFIMHVFVQRVIYIERFIVDALDIFAKPDITGEGKLRILILNWRDTRHRFAGGAELYIHEIAKRFIASGNSVTIFSGNDGHSIRNDKIDGITIKRRGGTFLVYIWAMVYYLIRYRGKYDVIIDCENGIPFFTPFYVRRPIVLLIHHIHQDVFRQYLMFPFSHIGSLLEAKVMPVLYRSKTVVTISESSKKSIKSIGLAKSGDIHIVNPGIAQELFSKRPKASYPLFSYVGRLKPYKNVDVIVRAFAPLKSAHPDARLVIMGDGDTKSDLVRLAKELEIQDVITFKGKVSEKEKANILAQSWAMLQPSMIEGWGITVIEANASGTPVIASDVPGLRDSIVDGVTGVLISPKDIDGFTKAMTNIVINEKYRGLLSKEAYLWSKQFTWDRSASEFMQAILSIKKDVRLSGYSEIALSTK